MSVLYSPKGVIVHWELPPKFLIREFRKTLKKALFAMPLGWQKAFLPMHFKVGADVRYKYKKRSDKYLRRKQKAKKHQIPLVFSWKTKNLSVNTPPKVSGTSKGVAGLFSVPWYVKMIPKHRNAPFLGQEITATRKDEALLMRNILVDQLEKQLRRMLPRSRRKRRIA